MQLGKSLSHDDPEWPSVLSAVLDALPELIATFDGDGRLRWINASGIDLLGYAEEKLHELLLSDLYPEPDFERVIGDALAEAAIRGSWIGAAALVTADDTCIETHQRWLAHEPAEKKTLALTLVARPLQNARELERRTVASVSRLPRLASCMT
jgi:PAS domain-containing protein